MEVVLSNCEGRVEQKEKNKKSGFCMDKGKRTNDKGHFLYRPFIEQFARYGLTDSLTLTGGLESASS
jgi:hypothetical protein